VKSWTELTCRLFNTNAQGAERLRHANQFPDNAKSVRTCSTIAAECEPLHRADFHHGLLAQQVPADERRPRAGNASGRCAPFHTARAGGHTRAKCALHDPSERSCERPFATSHSSPEHVEAREPVALAKQSVALVLAGVSPVLAGFARDGQRRVILHQYTHIVGTRASLATSAAARSESSQLWSSDSVGLRL
jgi:hypothetical protein